MGFVKGAPKPPNSGIKKGHKHKSKLLRQSVAEILTNLDVNPVHQLLKLVKDGRLNDKDKSRVWMDLMSYCYSKPRNDQTLEIEGQQHGFQVTIKDYSENKD